MRVESDTMSMKKLFRDNPEIYKKTYEGASPNIRVNRSERMTERQTILVLKNLRKIITTYPIEGDDCNITGMKNTTCTWGLCTESPEIYPDPLTHIWPFDFLAKEKRVEPLPPAIGFRCPLDRRSTGDLNGCFYCCAFFNSKPSKAFRQEIVAEIDRQLVDAEYCY